MATCTQCSKDVCPNGNEHSYKVKRYNDYSRGLKTVTFVCSCGHENFRKLTKKEIAVLENLHIEFEQGYRPGEI